jgi:hypothetical protein
MTSMPVSACCGTTPRTALLEITRQRFGVVLALPLARVQGHGQGSGTTRLPTCVVRILSIRALLVDCLCGGSISGP